MTTHPQTLALALALSSLACTQLYTLPDAPPKNEWINTQQQDKPTENWEEQQKRYLAAKRIAIEIYAAMADKNWKLALSHFSQASLEKLKTLNPDPEQALLDPKTWQKNESPFDPIDSVFINGLNDIVDLRKNVQDDESPERKVLHAINANDEAKALVFVLEDDDWKLDIATSAKPD